MPPRMATASTTLLSITRCPLVSLKPPRTFLTSNIASLARAIHAMPADPRPSASLIVINPRNEILFVQRNPKSRSFAGMHVFPGGNYDAKQDASLAITAIRETFEETGLLLASSGIGERGPTNEELDTARQDIHSQKQQFGEFLHAHNLTADIHSLMPFTQWTTPPAQPRRFRTQFYVTFLQASPASGFTSGDKVERLPTHDGGQEVISARFLHPDEALRECETRQITLMPPQFYLTTTLASILKGTVNTSEQRERVAALANGPFGRMSLNPQPLAHAAPPGRTILTYEGDESRGGPKGQLHRSIVKFEKGGVISEVILQRNFDVFKDVPADAFRGNAKL